MRKVFLDTETTGIEPGEVIQLTYSVCDTNSDGVEKVSFSKNFFFAVDYVEPSAQAVHGFDVKKLKVLSNGQTFKDVASEIAKDLKGGIFIAHNTNFDKKFLVAEFSRLSNINWTPAEYFCTMEYFKPIVGAKTKTGRPKYPRLEETMAFLEVDKDIVLKGAKRLFGCEDVGFHDARYDVAGLVSCYYKAQKLGYELNSPY